MVMPSVCPYPWISVHGNISSADFTTDTGIGPPPYWMLRRLRRSNEPKFSTAIIQFSIVVMPRKAETFSSWISSSAWRASKLTSTRGQPWAM